MLMLSLNLYLDCTLSALLLTFFDNLFAIGGHYIRQSDNEIVQTFSADTFGARALAHEQIKM